MVDSINIIGGVQGGSPSNATRNTQRTTEQRGNEAVQNQASIAGETLNLTQAEQAVSDIRQLLTENTDISLGLAQGFFDENA